LSRFAELAEYINFTDSQLKTMGVSQLVLVDNTTGHKLRVIDGTADYRAACSYDELRGGPSIVWGRGGISVPDDVPRRSPEELTAEMNTVVKAALDIYEEWLRHIVIVDDGQPRLLLVFRANVPEGAITLRANLGNLAAEVQKGLEPSVLREALDVLK
jgi:hypothetical protein